MWQARCSSPGWPAPWKEPGPPLTSITGRECVSFPLQRGPVQGPVGRTLETWREGPQPSPPLHPASPSRPGTPPLTPTGRAGAHPAHSRRGETCRAEGNPRPKGGGGRGQSEGVLNKESALGWKEHQAAPHLLDPQVLVRPSGGLEQGGPFRGPIGVSGHRLGAKRPREPQPRGGPAPPPRAPALGATLTGGLWPWPSTAEWSCSWCHWARRACWLPRTSRSS